MEIERMINTMFMDKMAPGILRLSVMDNDIDLFEGQYPVPVGAKDFRRHMSPRTAPCGQT